MQPTTFRERPSEVPSFVYNNYVGKTTEQIVYEYNLRKQEDLSRKNHLPVIFEVSELKKAIEILQKTIETQPKIKKAQQKARKAQQKHLKEMRGSYFPKQNHVKKQVDSHKKISDLFLVMIGIRDVKKS